MQSVPATAQDFYWPKENAAPAHVVNELTFRRRPGSGLCGSRDGEVVGGPSPGTPTLAPCLGVPHGASGHSRASPEPTAVGAPVLPAPRKSPSSLCCEEGFVSLLLYETCFNLN